jgi:hemoglobin
MATNPTSEKSLYARIGGYDVIAAIVDEFLETFSADPRTTRFTASASLDSRKRNRQFTLDYLAAASGGPTIYVGKDMKTAHAGVGISASEWKIAMDHIAGALVKLKVPERESQELLAIFEAARGDIVER